jgi:hypothetical protein
VQKTVKFWNLLNLSLSGKITIAKSLILPLINYYAIVLTFDNLVLNEIQECIEKFVVKGLNISKEKIYGNVSDGGLQLFKLSEFVTTLQSYWIKRIMHLQHDNWRNQVFFDSANGMFYLQDSDLTTFGEVLTGICKNFIRFRNDFGAVGNNYVPVLNNPYFSYKVHRVKGILDDNFFAPIAKLQGHKSLATLTWDDFLDVNLLLRNQADIIVSTGLIFNDDEYSKLNAAYRNVKRIFYKEGDKSIDFREFYQNLKKGSKKLRVVLNNVKSSTGTKINRKICPIKKFSEIGGVVYPEIEVTNQINCRWSKNYYSSDMRTFLFKLNHNTLGLNARVHHINQERDEACTFCTTVDLKIFQQKEKVFHIFFGIAQVFQVF